MTTPTSTPDAKPSLVGREIQGLKVESLLGRGGMGEVFKAYDPNLDRYVAIKLVGAAAADDPQFAARFHREAQTASAIHHPNVAQIHSAGSWMGRPFYVMEHIEGRSLAELLDERGTISGYSGLSYLIQAAEGLRAAQRSGVVHRDVKPANLMLDGGGRLKIVDFGLARRVAMESTLTQSNVVMGTPAYLAPEQALGQEIDHRADIYALGATFYQLFSGTLPFEADTPLAILMKHAREPLPPLKERNPRVPQPVCDIIERMMAKEPAARYADYDELLADLNAVKHGSGPVKRTGATRTGVHPRTITTPKTAPTAKPAWHQPAFWAIAALLFLLAITFLVPQKREADPIATIAERRAERPSPRSSPAQPAAAAPAPEQPAAPVGGDGAENQLLEALRRLPPGALEQLGLPDSLPTGEIPGGPPAVGNDTAPQGGQPSLQLEQLQEMMGSSPFAAMAKNAQTLAEMRKVWTAIQAYRAERGSDPRSLGQVQRVMDLNPRSLVDAWGSALELDRNGALLRLISSGPDRILGNEDDIVMEDGYVIQGGAGLTG